MGNDIVNATHKRNRQNRAEKRTFCYELRIQGHSERSIAAIATAHFGHNISDTTVHRLLTEETERRHRPTWEAFREYELDRTDRLLLALDARIRRGDPQAIMAAARVIERRCKLLGLDAPTKVQATVTETTQQDLELQEMLREARMRAAAREAELRQAEPPDQPQNGAGS